MPTRASAKLTSAVNVTATQKYTQEVYFCSFSKVTRRSLERDSAAAKSLADRRPILLADKRVFGLWEEAVKKIPLLQDMELLLLPVGEASKTLPTVETTVRSLCRMGATRNDVFIVGLGGGALLDTAGFVAGVFHRGVPLVHVPTTLLAMLDATLGGKAAVNFLGSKNQIGVFYMPCLTLIDLDFLTTLTPDHMRNGLIEAVKMAFLAGTRDLDATTHNAQKVLEGDLEAAGRVVLSSLRIKSSYVRDDLLDQNKRHHLNLGHTTGHALESVYGGRMTHGDAVANGMLVAPEISRELGLLTKRTDEVLSEALAATGFIPLGVHDAEHLARLLWGSMGADKKVQGGRMMFVLPVSPGKVELAPVSPETFAIAANRVFKAPSTVLESAAEDATQAGLAP